MTNVLFLEDEEGIALAIETALECHKIFDVTTVDTLQKALSLLPGEFSVVITDLNLPDSKGVHTIVALQRICEKIPIIVVTGGGDCDMAQAIHFGAQDYIVKCDFTFKDLIRSIQTAIERHKVRAMFNPIKEDIESASKMVEELKNLSVKVSS